MPVLTLRTKTQLLHEQSQRKEWHMQSTNIRQIKAALWQQAFLGDTGKLSHQAYYGDQEKEGATPGADPWVGAVVHR
jgi:hypothetical protein